MTHSVARFPCKDPRIPCTHLFHACPTCRPYLDDWVLVMAHKSKWRAMWKLGDVIVQSWAQPWALRFSDGGRNETFVVKYDEAAAHFETITPCKDHNVETWEDAIWEHIRPMSVDLGDNGDEPLW